MLNVYMISLRNAVVLACLGQGFSSQLTIVITIIIVVIIIIISDYPSGTKSSELILLSIKRFRSPAKSLWDAIMEDIIDSEAILITLILHMKATPA